MTHDLITRLGAIKMPTIAERRTRNEAMERITDLEAENTRLRHALGFYAHRGNYVSRVGMDSGIRDDNFGDRARAALGDDA